MSWSFFGQLSKKQLLPRAEEKYVIGSIVAKCPPETPSLVLNAEISAIICSSSYARRLLEDRGQSINDIADTAKPSTFGWLEYWHDQGCLDMVLAADDEILSHIRADLDRALFHEHIEAQIFGAGGFSKISPNPHSKQPTADDFETGQILPLREWTCALGRRTGEKEVE